MQFKEFIPHSVRQSAKRLLFRNSVLVSQAGQDYWVVGEVFNEQRSGFFLDVGAYDGVAISNTFLLEMKYGWKGICVEASPIAFKELERNRNCICLNLCLDSVEGDVDFVLQGVLGGISGVGDHGTSNASQGQQIVKLKSRRLMSILQEANAPKIIDYLSIDVEGAEDRILLDFPFDQYKFNAITIERPSTALREVFKQSGYILIKEIPGLDCFYIHREFLSNYTRNLFSFYRKRHFPLRWR